METGNLLPGEKEGEKGEGGRMRKERETRERKTGGQEEEGGIKKGGRPQGFARRTHLSCAIQKMHTVQSQPFGQHEMRLNDQSDIMGMGDLATGIWGARELHLDRKSTRLNSSHQIISYAVFCLKKKNKKNLLLRKKKQRST